MLEPRGLGVKDSVGAVSAPQAGSGASLLLKFFPANSSLFSEDAHFPDSPCYLVDAVCSDPGT